MLYIIFEELLCANVFQLPFILMSSIAQVKSVLKFLMFSTNESLE